MPSLGIYRPPAARRLEQTSPDGSVKTRQALSRTSSNENSPKSFTSNPQVNVSSSCDKKAARQRRPDMAVYVPRGRRIAEQHQRKLEESLNMCNDGVGVELELDSPPCLDQLPGSENRVDFSPCINVNSKNLESDKIINFKNEKPAHKIAISEPQTSHSPINGKSSLPESPKQETSEANHPCVQNIPVTTSDTTKSSQISEDSTVVNSPKVNSDRKVETKESNELDWDSLYDDSGECLDPAFLGQLANAVGKVTIETPKTSYEEYRHRNLEDEFPHVLEIYNFPAEFKTQDLIMIFSEYKQSGFEIKWVDDTHALGVFSSALIASEVLAMQHAFVKVRCLSEGTTQSKLKARKSGDSLTPYVQRPDTCAALARRLVTGALGVKLPTLRAEREAERKLLKEAREKKRLAAKQREEAWEGTFS